MKKGTYLIAIIVVIILGGILIYPKNYFLAKEPIKKNNNVSNEINKNTEVKFGNMIFSYPNYSLVTTNNLPVLNIVLKQSLAFISDNNLKSYDNNAEVHFFVSKNESPKNISLEEWLDQNAPYAGKTSAYSPVSTTETKINGLDAIYLVSHVSDNRTGGYYDLRTLYIFYKSDVYEIESYKLPQEPDPALTSEDIKNIKEYEKTVDQIIQSIRFVE